MTATSPQQTGAVIGNTPGNGTENAGEALKHLATAFAFLLAGLAALFFNSELLANGGARTARVVAGLHFLTLGWLTLSIFGALQVFSGVALGGKPLNRSLPAKGRWIWSAGLLLFVAGFLAERTAALAVGILLLGLALALYTIQVVPALVNAKRGQITRVFIGIAFLSLWCAWILGTLGGLARAGWAPVLGFLPPGYFQAHILLAVFGWVGSMVIGVGAHLVPMFALSRGGSQTALKFALAFWILLPVTGVLSAFVPDPWVSVSWKAAAVGSVAWAIQFQSYLRARIRRERDYGLQIAALATVFLLVAWIGAGFLDDPVPFIALAVVGWLSFFTLGIYHRVVPFLVWFVRFSRPTKGAPPPKVKDLTDPRVSLLVGAAAAPGILLWILGVSLHSALAAYLGSALLFAAVSCALLQIKPLFFSPFHSKKEAEHGTFERSRSATS